MGDKAPEAIEVRVNEVKGKRLFLGAMETQALADRKALLAEVKRLNEQFSSVTAERDAAVEFIRFLDMNYAGYIQDSDRFDEWRGKYGRSSKNDR